MPRDIAPSGGVFIDGERAPARVNSFRVDCEPVDIEPNRKFRLDPVDAVVMRDKPAGAEIGNIHLVGAFRGRGWRGVIAAPVEVV